MAKPEFPLRIDRRYLLKSAVAATATGIAPVGKPGDTAAAAAVAQSFGMATEAEPANFCAATARRLLEIARRNEIRREANLPLLSVAQELRCMKRQEDSAEFERFEMVYGKAVLDQLLKRRREAEGQNWRPNFMEGMCLQNKVRGILWRQFRASSQLFVF